MKIEILGSGCANCKRLEENVRKACKEAGVKADIEKVQDWKKIASYGVMMTPGLVIDGAVMVQGRVPDAREIGEMLKKK